MSAFELRVATPSGGASNSKNTLDFKTGGRRDGQERESQFAFAEGSRC